MSRFNVDEARKRLRHAYWNDKKPVEEWIPTDCALSVIKNLGVKARIVSLCRGSALVRVG
jgi:hypothetical protein